ncbi:MAG: hypothetical protein ACO1RT_18425 [Planctomycetaceae bacterium]
MTLAVNPAFLEEIKDSNTHLWQQLAQLRETCDSREARSSVLHRLVPLMNEVRDLLALQFALEESYGYIEVPASIATPLPHSIEHARAQHCALYLKASELAEQAEELEYRGWVAERVDQLVRQVVQFDLQFQDHERTERELISASRSAARHRMSDR